MQNIIHEHFNDKRSDLGLHTAHNSVVSMHFHRCYELIYVIDGIIDCVVGKEDLHAGGGDFIFIQKYYSHSYDVIENYHKFVFMIPPNIYNDFEKTLGKNTLPPLLDDKRFNTKLLPYILDLYDNFSGKSALIKKGFMNIIMGELIAHYKSVPIEKNTNVELLKKILDYIDENYYKPLSLETLSAAFGYNKYYFSKLFNRFIGENINNYINIVRLQQMMNKAKKLDKVNIAELAFDCGFDSLSTFYRYFGKIYGVSPKEALKTNK